MSELGDGSVVANIRNANLGEVENALRDATTEMKDALYEAIPDETADELIPIGEEQIFDVARAVKNKTD
jgi:hypothetical protein